MAYGYPMNKYKSIRDYINEKNINLAVNSSGDFDIPKAKSGGLDSPFMSIYIPSDKSENEAFKLANSLIELVKNIIESNEDFEYASSPQDVIDNFKKLRKRFFLPFF